MLTALSAKTNVPDTKAYRNICNELKSYLVSRFCKSNVGVIRYERESEFNDGTIVSVATIVSATLPLVHYLLRSFTVFSRSVTVGVAPS